MTADVPSLAEWRRAQDIDEEEPPRRMRIQGKRPGPEGPMRPSPDPEELPPQDSDDELIPAEPPRVRSRSSREPHGVEQAGHWCDEVTESAWEHESGAHWESKDAAIALAVDWPESRRGQEQALQNLEGFFVGAFKRRTAEVSEKRLTEEERKMFAGAKAVEVRNFVAAKAFEAVPEDRRPGDGDEMDPYMEVKR